MTFRVSRVGRHFIFFLFAASLSSWGLTGPQPLTHTIAVTSTGFQIGIHSQNENVNYQWLAPLPGSSYSMGTVVVTDSINGSSPQGQIALGSGMDWIGPSEVVQSITYQAASVPTITLTFLGPDGTTHLTVSPIVDGSFVGLRLSADRATIKDIRLGQLSSSLSAQEISVPYYSQAVNYIGSLDLFENSYFDAFDSHATTISTAAGQETFYAVNENGTANPLNDIWKVSVSNDIMNVLPYPEHSASPYMSQLAGRMILDVTGGTFATIAAQVANLGDYGVNHCGVIIGDWQRFGYDNGYPSQYPANTSLGGDGPMRSIGSAARSHSCLFGLHENYADYYPNYPEYNPAATMRNSDGTQLLSWFNPVTGIQSFATKPGLFVPNAATQSPFIHEAYGTNATFIDVNSTATPWWRADEDPSTFGSGMFGIYRDGSIALWAYERNVEGGPVLGEGKYHWFWSGLLDGVEAQFGAESTPITNGLLAPLFVDFDLTRIHPLQVNYGMGYYDRWTPGAATITSTLELDAYRMQEVIFGHSPYLTDALWSSVPRALLEQDLVSPFATRNALQTPNAIAYMVQGVWGDASTAAKAGDFSLAQVTYPNGDSVIANSRSSTVSWNSLQIPQYGWAAKGPGFLAYTALLGNQIADYCQTPASIYANARNQADILSENTLATPSVASFNQVAPKIVQIQLAWDVNTPDPTTEYQEFIHFVSSQAGEGSNSLSGATGGTPLVPTESWVTGEHVADNTWTFYLPPTMPDGTYEVRVGLFSGAQRAVLYGNNDGNLRYTVGSISVSQNGSSITFNAVPIAIPNPDPRLNSSGSLVDFGTIRTDGMVLLQQQTGQGANDLELSSYPRSRDVAIQINSQDVAMPAAVTCDNGDVLVPTMVAAPYWEVDLRGRKYCTWTGTLP
jgi:hypothetical protein